MSIKYIVLGFLSWQPATGYELKRIISESETLPWSGNSNQIYRALVELHEAEFVTVQVEPQEKLPTRKIYSITPSGKEALGQWAQEAPQALEVKKAFLNQLLWADSVHPAKLDQLLDQYLDAVGEKLFLVRVQADRKPDTPDRTSRETYIWEMVRRNWIATYEMELSWIRQMREELAEFDRDFARRG